ncbi:lytic transglycosylase domain-containing protein [Acetobacter papayae]|uniref:lytic transglycosylase domain-containing protein n=1 Tax=Acetobacter papayae TaxID=1076592 RepID=UPI001F1636B4|nr:lytic transglycosylase domain-containing protein [Acetobacter papayae]
MSMNSSFSPCWRQRAGGSDRSSATAMAATTWGRPRSIPSISELARLGITREQVINDGCLNLQIGAWILARALDGQSPSNPGEFWRRVGNYNSATPIPNVTYQAKVWSHLVAHTASQRMSAQ